jgi:Protein of unknown function (DUF1499)
MTVHIEQQTARAAGWSCATAFFSAVLFVTAALSHRFGLLETPSFLTILGLVAVLAVLALLLAASSFSRVWNHGDRGGGDIAKGVIVALLVLVPFLISGYRGYVRPELNDISTDTIDPPQFSRAALARKPGMNPIGPIDWTALRIQAERYPEITGRRYDASADRVLNAVLAIVSRRGWQIYEAPLEITSSPEVTVEAVARTLLLAFPCDVAIRVTDEGASSYVDMRSASRFGKHDLGDNAARVVAFLEELDADVAAQAGALPAE